MATEIRVPTLGESVTEATIGKWFKKVGEAVKPTSRWSSSRPTR
jgi:2-oxoglutarate dehydrogenase E2 component (dihydrolipoamide succinyltransferase)